MRKADIIVGAEYAYANHKYSPVRRVEVLTVGVARSRSGVNDGVAVKFLDEAPGQWSSEHIHDVRTVASRQIIRPWAEQEVIIQAEAERKAEQKRLRDKTLDRANSVRDQLIAAGFSESDIGVIEPTGWRSPKTPIIIDARDIGLRVSFTGEAIFPMLDLLGQAGS